MKYKVTLNGKTYEVEVEKGEAIVVAEYAAYAPAAAPATARSCGCSCTGGCHRFGACCRAELHRHRVRRAETLWRLRCPERF